MKLHVDTVVDVVSPVRLYSRAYTAPPPFRTAWLPVNRDAAIDVDVFRVYTDALDSNSRPPPPLLATLPSSVDR